MPIVYTYPTVTPASNDLLLLSDASDSRKTTKSATISSVLGLGVATSKVVVSSAEVLALHTTPIELIAAPGANKIIQILGVMASIDFNSLAYVKKDLWVIYAGAVRSTYEWTNAILNSGIDYIEYASFNTSIFGPTATINTAVQLSIEAATATGDSPITIYTTYKTLDV